MPFPGELLLARDGVTLLEQCLDRSILERWAEIIQHRYTTLGPVRSHSRADAVSCRLLPGERFVPTASSYTLQGALGEAGVGAVVDQLAKAGVIDAIGTALGGALLVNLDQSWVRRQYAPDHYPPLHAPHGWHQDGALGFDFGAWGAKPPAEDALLPMVTCWFPLGACGSDAPGLELVLQRQRELLPVIDLTEAVLRCKFPAEAYWRPIMEAGDVLLFCGDILHRTHVTPAMTRDRSSIELRFFPADRLPERLAGDRFASLALA